MRDKIIRSLKLLRSRSIITGTMAAGALLLPFYQSIGLNQLWFGATQAWFTAICMVLTVPAGWLADRISRRMFILLGDIIAAIGFICYATADGLGGVFLAEGVLAIGASLSGGADDGLLNSYLTPLNNRRKRNENFRTWLAIGRPTTQTLLLLTVAVVYHFTDEIRLAFWIGAVPFVIGAILSYYMLESGDEPEGETAARQHAHERLIAVLRMGLTKLSHPRALVAWVSEQWKNTVDSAIQLRDTLKSARRDKRLFTLMLASSVAFRITTPLNITLTAIMLAAGIPVEVAALAWIIKPVSVITGGVLGRTVGVKFGPFGRFFAPSLGVLCALVVMMSFLTVTPWSVGAFLLIGMAEGWFGVVMTPMVQAAAPHDHQSTITSTTEAIYQALYFVLVLSLSAIATYDVPTMLLVAMVLFAIMIVPLWIKLWTVRLPAEDEEVTWPE